MNNILSWIKRNKLSTFLILIIVFSFFSNLNRSSTSRYDVSNLATQSMPAYDSGAVGNSMSKDKMAVNSFQEQAAPISTTSQRVVIQNSYLSLVVKNVTEVQKQILDRTVQAGGFMVETSLQNPQEAANSTVTVRIPANKLDETLAYYRKLSVKVVSENLQGTDVTDQYVDIEERMKTLQKTKAKFDEILDKATQVSDILNVQRELINLQTEIDSLKGQQDYLKKSADMAKITIYLSTDELSLPYAPSYSWRPSVIFKEAVRSVIGTLRSLGELAIWTTVYSLILIPIALIAYFIWKRFKPKENKPLNSKSPIVH